MSFFKTHYTVTIDNIILIKGGAYNDIKKALRQWIDLYSKEFPDGLTFQLFKNGQENHVIQVDERVDNVRFFYLLNYLNYPEGIHYKIDIQGYTTGKTDDKFKNQNLLVYISPSDKDYDNVCITTSENKKFKLDFGGKIMELNEGRNYQIPNTDLFINPEVIILNKNSQNRKAASRNYIEKRFKIVSFIAIALFFVSLAISFFDTQTYIKAIFFFSMGLGLWFFIDYEMLQSDKYFIYSLIISVMFLSYTILVKIRLNRMDLDFIDFGSFSPLTLLVTQWPMRKIYLAIFNREPNVDKHGKFADLIYTIILLFGFAVLPLLIMDYIR